MYTLINTSTKQYLRNDWDQHKGLLYTHSIDLAARFSSWSEADDHKEENEIVYLISHQ